MDAKIISFIKNTPIKRVFALFIAIINLGFCLVLSFDEPITDRNDVKNVIMMIGDGMGENTLKLAKKTRNITLNMETVPLRGQSQTASMEAVTDSAAGATALACGVRTTNGCVGVYPQDMYAFVSYPINIREAAAEKGMKTGVVTTDSNTGATPSGYTAHTSARGNADDISAQQLALDDISFIWSANSDVTTEVDCAANGYTYVDTLDEFNALTPSDKSFGQFGDDTWMLDPESDSPNLEEMVTKAIATLSTNNTKGFFLMVEGAHIDKMSHKNDVEGAAEAVEEFDKAVKIALDFAKADGNTLVVITADHETGAIKETNGDYVYTSGSHSSANVPLLVYGCDNFIDQGEAVKNRNIPCYIASALNIENAFPRKIAA